MIRTVPGIISTDSTTSVRTLRPGNRSTPKAKPASSEVTRHSSTVHEAIRIVFPNRRSHGAECQARDQFDQSQCGTSTGGKLLNSPGWPSEITTVQ